MFTSSRVFLLLAALFFILFLILQAQAADFYRYTDSGGAVSFTTDLKSVPSAFQASAQHFTSADLNAATAKQFTPLPAPALGAPSVPSATPPPVVDTAPCVSVSVPTGTITIREEWETSGARHRKVYIVVGPDGTELSRSYSAPHAFINH